MAGADRRDAGAGSAPTWFFLLAASVLLAALIFGGSSRGGNGDLLVRLLALLLLCAQILLPRPAPALLPWLLLPPLLLAAVPLLQLLPWPIAWWPAGTLRQQLQQDLAAAGAGLAPQLSLLPLSAERALWFLLPAAALWTAVLRLGQRQQGRLVLLLLLAAAGNAVLGLAQLADGQQSPLRLYSPTNVSDAVGLFANRNHLAALLVAVLPFALAAAVLAFQRRGVVHSNHSLRGIGLIGLAVLLLLGIALTRSRAGVALGMLALILCLPLLLRLRERHRAGWSLTAVLLIAGVCIVQFALFGLWQRLDRDPLDDGRVEYARVLAVAATASAPLGSGLGSFPRVYPQYEAETGAGPHDVVINHAHNDYLELWLEARWLFAAVLLVFLAGLVGIGWRLWRGLGFATPERLLTSRLAYVSVLMLLLHAAVDYPLRTTALSAVFAVLLALAARGPAHR
ncbi:MAG: O-antigen ligase family protein [Lysobacterales bacterium]